MPQGPSRRAYARTWEVDESAIRKAIRAGTIYLHPDGSIDAEASDAVWGRRHAEMLAGPEPPDPVWLAEIDRDLAQLEADLGGYIPMDDDEIDRLLEETLR